MSETGGIAKPPPAAAYSRDAATPEAPDAKHPTPPPDPEAPHVDPAIRLASRLANLAIGQAILGDVLRQQEEGRPLLRTPQGDFAVDPVRALPTRGSVEILLTRITPSTDGSDLTGLLIARNGQPVDPPQTVRLTLVQLPDTPRAPLPTATPAPLLKIALDTLPEAARRALAIPTELAGTALLAPSQGTLRAGLIPPVAAQAPPATVPGSPYPAGPAPKVAPLSPPPALQALRPVVAPVAGAFSPPPSTVPPLPEPGSRIAHAPAPEYPLPSYSVAPARQAEPAPGHSSPQQQRAPRTVQPDTAQAQHSTDAPRLAPRATGSGPAVATPQVAKPDFSPDPWLKAPTLVLATAQGRPLGQVSVVAAEPATAHSLLRTPPPDSPLGRLVTAGKLVIAETGTPNERSAAERPAAPLAQSTPAPEHRSQSLALPAQREVVAVPPLRIVANGLEYTLEVPQGLPADAPPTRLLLLHTGPTDTQGAAPALLAVQTTGPDGAVRAPVVATVAFLFRALGHQGFRVEALEPLARLPDLTPLARLAAGETPTPEVPRLHLTLQPPGPQAPPIQAVLWFQPQPRQGDGQSEDGGGEDTGAGFHIDIAFPGLGDSRLSGALRTQGLDLRFASRNPVSAALQASTQAAFRAALGDRPGRLSFQLLAG